MQNTKELTQQVESVSKVLVTIENTLTIRAFVKNVLAVQEQALKH